MFSNTIGRIAALVILVLAGAIPSTAKAEPALDLLLLNARVVDGTGDAAYMADVGIRNGRIAAIGGLQGANASDRIDLDGLVLAPGFIDTHNHADQGIVDPALRTNKGFITQGVTTTIFGVDGAYSLDQVQQMREIFNRQGIGTNYMFYIGHGGVRLAVMGTEKRPPSTEEMAAMRAMVKAAMEQGALGLSSGLMYLPGKFADTDELIELGRVAGMYGGLYDSHVRDPARNLLESIDESLTIAWKSGLSAHPAHLKAVGAANFGKSTEIAALISSWQSRGLGVTADLYPYDGAATAKLVEILVPPADSPAREMIARWREAGKSSAEQAEITREATRYYRQALQVPKTREAIRQATENPSKGVFSWVVTVGYESYRIVVSDTPEYVGRMLTDIAAEQERTPFDLIAELIVDEGMRTKITLGAIQENDVQVLLKQPWVMVSSDGGESGFENGGGHPRYRGTFPRLMGRYVREWGVLSLEEAVYKVTSLPASYLQLRDRGVIREGAWADLVVFNADKIIDRSTWDTPEPYSEGVIHVLVNGEFALKNAVMTGETHGRYLPFRRRGEL
jgi:N-acyl-D-aspartate/D-glutamate deacylase